MQNFCFTQNLVPNPSFENFTSCPGNLGEIYKANGWYFCNNTSPDYFNPCASVSSAEVPDNAFGHQTSYNGNSYTGIITYYNSSFYREILRVQLTMPLIVSQKYFISFMINRGNDNAFVGYSTNNIGVRFSTLQLDSILIDNWAHYYDTSVMTDTSNWVRVFGSFVADSSYEYLMISNFFDDANSIITNQSPGIYAYYFLDDICVSTDSLYTQTYSTKVIEKANFEENKVFPNPANNFIYLPFQMNEMAKIYSSYGELIFTISSLANNSNIVDTSAWPDGIYLLVNNSKKYKIVINH